MIAGFELRRIPAARLKALATGRTGNVCMQWKDRMEDQTVELEFWFVTSLDFRSYRLEVGVIMV